MFCPKCGTESPDDSQFCRKCGHTLAAAALTAPPSPALTASKPVRPAFILAVLLALVILGWFIDHSSHQGVTTTIASPRTPVEHDVENVSDFYHNNTPAPPLIRTVNIGKGALSVAALHYAFYTLPVPPGAHNVKVQGHFEATGGTGNDIEVFLLNDEQFTNWKNGHATATYYNSGRLTVGDMQAGLPDGGGTYYLIFNNNFSALTAKAVEFNGTMVYYP